MSLTRKLSSNPRPFSLSSLRYEIFCQRKSHIMNLDVSHSGGDSNISDVRLEYLQSIISESFALESELENLSRQIYPARELKELIDDAHLPVNQRLREIFIEAF